MITCVKPNEISQLGANMVVIDTTSRATGWSKELSPFLLHCEKYPSVTVENLWQYSKFFDCHGELYICDNEEIPLPIKIAGAQSSLLLREVQAYDGFSAFKKWANDGMSQKKSVRYPMGKGKKPICSLIRINDKFFAMDYIQARQLLYVPAYATAVVKTDAYKRIEELYQNGKNIALVDFDARNCPFGFNYQINDKSAILGHSAILMALLTNRITV